MLSLLFLALAALGGAAIGALGSRHYWEQRQLNRLVDRFLAKHEI